MGRISSRKKEGRSQRRPRQRTELLVSRLSLRPVEMTDRYFICPFNGPSFGEVPTLSFSLWLVRS